MKKRFAGIRNIFIKPKLSDITYDTILKRGKLPNITKVMIGNEDGIIAEWPIPQDLDEGDTVVVEFDPKNVTFKISDQ